MKGQLEALVVSYKEFKKGYDKKIKSTKNTETLYKYAAKKAIISHVIEDLESILSANHEDN